ncbi:hypothetical protein BGX27_004083 [Mortierella sp. AM989]|nr:hypothetical protein BGX27_004083 [Mortierella sp. AM989]
MPFYLIVAEGDDIDLLRDELVHLSQLARISIQGKITSKKITTWLKGPSTPTAVSPPEVQLQQDEEDEELLEGGYLSDLSMLSNEDMAGDYTLEPNGRMLRRTVSLEDMKNASSLHHLLLEEDHPQRPASSASMSLLVPSDTLSSLHHEHHRLQTPYQYPDSSFMIETERAQSTMSPRQHEENYTLYNHYDKHDHYDLMGVTEGDLDDIIRYNSRRLHGQGLDDGKSTRSFYTTSPALTEHHGSRIRTSDETTLNRDEQGVNGILGWLHASPILDAIINWVEGPTNRPATKKNDKPSPIADIPFQFIALLTYPEPDPRAGGKMTLARRMNVNMAKRAVNQRVGWAKQWAGGIFRKNGGGAGNSTNNQSGVLDLSTQQQQQQQHATNSNMSSSKSMPNFVADSIRGTQTSIAREKIEIAQEESPQTKRRGLFGKRRTLNSTSATTMSQNGATSSVLSPLADGVHGTDESQSVRVPKRGFFKRNTNTSASRSATAPPSAPITLSVGSAIPSPVSASPPADASTSDPFQSILVPQPAAISSSFLSQTQSLPQLQLLPPRSPSPSAIRRDISWPKPWGAISSLPLQQQQQQHAETPPSSVPPSASASPIAVSTPTSNHQQPGKSLVSINPLSFLSGFTQSQKQQHSVSTAFSVGNPTTNVIPVSPRPMNATSLPTSILTNDHDHLDMLTRGGAILFEGDEIGEPTLDYIMPVTKFSSSPESLSVSSFAGAPYMATDGLLDPVTSAAAEAMEA